MIETVGRDERLGKAYLLAEVDRLEDWPEQVDGLEPHFVLLIALDADGLPVEPISTFAERLLDQGAAYVVAWGAGCERVHDIFDEVIVSWEIEGRWPEDKLVMTTWHSDESLAEALDFAVHDAHPSDFEETWHALLAVSVGNPTWAAEIRELLADVDRLSDIAEADEARRQERLSTAPRRGLRGIFRRRFRTP